MKKLLTGMGMLCFTMNLWSQVEDIHAFQKQNPDIAFISQDRFTTFTNEEIALLNGKYIVFKNEIELSDISNYPLDVHTKKVQATPDSQTEASPEDQLSIKIWLGEHPQVKIIKHSEYLAMSEEDKIVYMNAHCMILLGETITLTDIALYPY